MFFRDKLSRNERIRLECLAQANITQGKLYSPTDILKMAKDFERYVKNGDTK